MSLFVPAAAAWARRHWSWSNDRQAWQERGALAVVLTGFVVLIGYGPRLAFGPRVALGAILVGGVVVLSWRGWIRLFGPVLVYDLVRTARRPQQLLLRGLYAAFLLAVLFVVYVGWGFRRDFGVRDFFTGAALDGHALADFANSFFLAFLIVQFVAACLLTPACTAPALPDDRESKTLEFLFTTDLHSREIVLGLATARLANLMLLLLTGLPVLALMQFLGGIDPRLLLAGFAFTGLTMLSLTGLAIVVAVYARNPRQAVVRTYLAALAYLVAAQLSWLLLLPVLGWASYPSTATWSSPLEVEDLVEAFNTGNPVAVVIQLMAGLGAGKSLDALLPDALGKYAWFHGLTAAGFLIWALLRLRAVTLRELVPAARPKPAKKARRRWLGVGNWPLVWKELVAERGVRLGWMGRIAVGVLVPVSFLPALGIVYYYRVLGAPHEDPEEFATAMNLWVRGMGTFVACLLLVGVATRAAESISGERRRQTLDSLLTTRLSRGAILASKWLGSIAGPRWGFAWLILIGVVGICTGGLDWRAAPTLILVWVVYAAFLAGLGLWMSVTSRTPRRALLGTLLATAVLGGGHLLFWVIGLALIPGAGGSGPTWQAWLELQAFGLTPPVALVILATPAREWGGWTAADWQWVRELVIHGLTLWVMAAAVCAAQAAIRFLAPISPRTSWPRWAGGLGLASLLLLAGWYVLRGTTAAERLRDAIAETDRLDPGWRLEDLEAKRAVIADADNGALQVPAIPDERTAARRPRWYPGKQWPTEGLDQLLQDLEPHVQLDAGQIEALTENLEDVEQTLIQARRMADFPHGRSPIEYTKDAISTLLIYTQSKRQIANLLAYDALLCAQENDGDTALADCRGMVNTAGAIGDEPGLISQLCRLACCRLALLRLERILAQTQPSERALAALQHRLEKEAEEPTLLIAARGERAIFDRFFEAMGNGDIPLQRIWYGRAFYDVNVSWLDRLMLASGLSVAHHRAAHLHFANEYVELAKLPYEAQGPGRQELSERVADLTGVVHNVVWPSGRPLTIVLQFELHKRQAIFLRCAIVLLACERYRRAHGQWPASLEMLVPQHLGRIPLDPYDGQPLRYRQRQGGIVVYSIGPDGCDNGGTLSTAPFNIKGPHAYGRADEDDKDMGYRLWDVDLRRQPPKSTK
jgi:ABC-type transport system involved in multi-copper enzyme maturation permease subunit